MDVIHNSRLACYRFPQGAVAAGQSVTIAIETGEACVRAMLRLWVNSARQTLPMGQAPCERGRRFTQSLHLSDTPGWAWYHFQLDYADGTIHYYGGESGEGSLYPYEPPGYQITIYDPAFDTPRWFREGILYQVYPDRFRRAGSGDEGVRYHRALGRDVRIHEDWNEQPTYLPEQGQTHYVPNDFFLGDFAGIRRSLPYFKELGITCLYLNPVFESASNHRYDTADYRKIDPMLGNNEEFKELCAQFRASGIRIMLDGVFSHTGADSVYFNKYGRYPALGAYQSESSPYRGWYEFHGLFVHGYRSWWGFPELPEVNELDERYLGFIIDEEDSLLAHWAQHHMTSWRLDVADELPGAFIAKMRARLKQLDPDSVLLGEVWEDASNKEAYGERRAYVLGNELDSVMNYPFREAILAFLTGHQDAYAFNHHMQILRERYPKPFYYAAMNLVSTHDSVRAIAALGGAPSRDALTREQQATFRLSPENEETSKRRLMLAAAVQMAIPGVPSIYYGDEAGVCGMADPFNRATYPWGKEDSTLLASYRKLAALRTQSIALRAGYCAMGALSQDVYAILRFTHNGCDAFNNEATDEAVLCVINRSELPVHVRLTPGSLPEGPDAEHIPSLMGEWQSAFDGLCVQSPTEAVEFIIPALSSLFLQKCVRPENGENASQQ